MRFVSLRCRCGRRRHQCGAGWFVLHLKKKSLSLKLFQLFHFTRCTVSPARTKDETKLKLIQLQQQQQQQNQQNPTMAISFGRNAFIDPFAMNTFLQLTSFFALYKFSLHSAGSQVVRITFIVVVVIQLKLFEYVFQVAYTSRVRRTWFVAHNVEANERVITAVCRECMGIGYG